MPGKILTLIQRRRIAMSMMRTAFVFFAFAYANDAVASYGFLFEHDRHSLSDLKTMFESSWFSSPDSMGEIPYFAAEYGRDIMNIASFFGTLMLAGSALFDVWTTRRWMPVLACGIMLPYMIVEGSSGLYFLMRLSSTDSGLYWLVVDMLLRTHDTLGPSRLVFPIGLFLLLAWIVLLSPRGVWRMVSLSLVLVTLFGVLAGFLNGEYELGQALASLPIPRTHGVTRMVWDALTASLILVGSVVVPRLAHPRSADICPACGYSTLGLKGTTCPECGGSINAASDPTT